MQRWMDEVSMNYVVDAVHRDIANLVPNADFADLSDLDQPGWSTTNHFLINEYKIAGARYYAKWLAVATAMGW